MSEKQLEEIKKELEYIREQVKVFAVSLSMIHSDVCRLLNALGVLK